MSIALIIAVVLGVASGAGAVATYRQAAGLGARVGAAESTLAQARDRMIMLEKGVQGVQMEQQRLDQRQDDLELALERQVKDLMKLRRELQELRDAFRECCAREPQLG